MTFKIATLIGSEREGSKNHQLRNAVINIGRDTFSFEAVGDMRQLPIYSREIEDNGIPQIVEDMAEIIRGADGLMIFSPEYNYSVPGPLKNQIDWLSRVKNQPFEGKPLSIMTASPSPMGGARMQYHIRDIFVALGGRVVNRPEVAVAFASDRLSNEGVTHDKTREVIENHLDAYKSLLKTFA
jgi:chromate reductase